MQQRVGLGDVIDVGRGGDQGMHQPRGGIDANVCFHAEVPLIAFLGLMHLRIALAVLVLGRGRRGDQCGINDRAFAE